MAEQLKHFSPIVFQNTHPFQIGIQKVFENNRTKYFAAVAYHSGLFRIVYEQKILNYERIPIKDLDIYKEIPASLNCTSSSKNFYCVLELTIKEGKLVDKDPAAIVWVESDRSVEELRPFVFESCGENCETQTKARIIIGVIVCDTERVPGLPQNQSVKFRYIIQYINTNLRIAPYCINGKGAFYAEPFSGGRLNF
jgi:hypothetical protein